MSEEQPPYSTWSSEALVERVLSLEKELKETQRQYALRHRGTTASEESPQPPQPTKKIREFDWSKYSTRFIALKFAYLGKRYNGFEHHANNKTPLPTVEETVWKALMKARLINPQGDITIKHHAIDWEGCDYSKCGRTDKGVSAFGQVIGLRIRSNRPIPKTSAPVLDPSGQEAGEASLGAAGSEKPFDEIADEMPYLQILNSLLPPDIRMLAWCPAPPPDFSARFSCRERRYRYFFTQPAFSPTPGQTGLDKALTHGAAQEGPRREAWLDIESMQAAAKRFEGLHDFRNFCKIDGSKQISDFRRRIFHAEIRELSAAEQPAAFMDQHLYSEFIQTPKAEAGQAAVSAVPKTYVFDLRGSAFLWHQVRHMVAVLFLVGQGLERPEVIDALLDASAFPSKPQYEMAEETPLVLWDCIFPAADDEGQRADALDWVYIGDEQPAARAGRASRRSASGDSTGPGHGKFGIGGLVNESWRLWRERRMDELLAGSMLGLVAAQGRATADPVIAGRSNSQRVFAGGDEAVHRGVYVPLLQRRRMKSAEILNREYAERHGLVKKNGGLKGAAGGVEEKRNDHVE